MSIYKNKTLQRGYLYPPQPVFTSVGYFNPPQLRRLQICECDKKRRGYEGGCCGNCGGAIPTKQELEYLKEN